jgi:hypothetical protein
VIKLREGLYTIWFKSKRSGHMRRRRFARIARFASASWSLALWCVRQGPCTGPAAHRWPLAPSPSAPPLVPRRATHQKRKPRGRDGAAFLGIRSVSASVALARTHARGGKRKKKTHPAAGRVAIPARVCRRRGRRGG